MREYFEAEMRLLHEAAQEFARAYPEQARMLNLNELRDRDPYIERLLEGTAYLTAGIRSRIDHAQTAISEQLLAHVCPQLLSPYPSTTIVEFHSEAYRQVRCTLPAGVELLSEPVGKEAVVCRFRTSRSLDILPLAVETVEATERAGGYTELRIAVCLDDNADLNALELDSLPIFLHADPPLAGALYQGLCQGLDRLRVHYDLDGRPQVRDLGGQERVQPLHLEPEEAMLPTSDRGNSGFGLLHDYFCAREKFLFVAVGGLSELDWPKGCRRFELELRCRTRLPAEHKLGEENIRLHCVPAVNLFATESEPVNIDHRRSEYRIMADVRLPEAVQVYSVDAVTSRAHLTGSVHQYLPLYAQRLRRESERYYNSTRRDHGTGMPLTYIALGGLQDFEPESLSCDITACNGHLPRQYLHENQVRTPSPAIPSGIRFCNITRPTPLWNPPAAKEYPWRLNALLALNVGSLARPEALRQLLALFDWTGRLENRRRIEGIIDVQAEPVSRMKSGMLHRGLEVTISAQEGCFASFGDVYLFGQVLHRFLSLSANLNEFIQTRLVCQPSHQEFLWAPRLGRSSPL